MVGTIYSLNSDNRSHFIFLSIFTLSNNDIYVDHLENNKWIPVAGIGESLTLKELEVNGTVLRGDALARLLADLRPRNDKTDYNLRVNCDGACYIHNGKAQDFDGTKLSSSVVFDWSKYGVRTAVQDELEDRLQIKEVVNRQLLDQVKNLEEELVKCKTVVEEKNVDLESTRLQSERANKEIGLISGELEKKKMEGDHHEKVMEAMDKEVRGWKLQVRDREEELGFCTRRLERVEKVVVEMEGMLEEKERVIRMVKLEVKEVREELGFYKRVLEKKCRAIEELEDEVEVKRKEARRLESRLGDKEEEVGAVKRLLKEKKEVEEGEKGKEIEWCRFQLKVKEEELCVCKNLLEWKDKVLEMKDRVLEEMEVGRDVVELEL
ncbi:unnamed protein product [Linum trigynum]|uniref:Uncharacterized protein n=1 Tax=Linum trigynum TaxID=586398 RepID=A0AAV2FYR2_9ROSI